MDTLVIIIGINNTSIIKQVPNHEQKQNLLSLPINIYFSHNVQLYCFITNQSVGWFMTPTLHFIHCYTNWIHATKGLIWLSSVKVSVTRSSKSSCPYSKKRCNTRISQIDNSFLKKWQELATVHEQLRLTPKVYCVSSTKPIRSHVWVQWRSRH